MKSKILIVDDEESIRFTFKRLLDNAGYDAQTAGDLDEGLEKLSSTQFDLVMADLVLGRESGLSILRNMRDRNLTCPLVFVTGYPDVATASEAVRLGAFDYLPKPVCKDDMLRVADDALRRKKISDEKEQYRSSLEAVFRSVDDAMITVDRDLALTALNKAAAGCGFAPDDIGKAFQLAGCNGKCLEALKEVVETNKPVEAHCVECPRKSGPARLVTLKASPLQDGKGMFCGAVIVIRDEIPLLPDKVRERRHGLRHMVGASEKMQRIYSLVENLADVGTSVLITGESGTGKELLAEAIHYEGKRGDRTLVKVNCSALSENLLESELFGHVKGAFTGAARDKVGRFQLADGGTIFLDEIGDISHGVQKRLLRVLQEKEFERVGESRPIKADVRVIAATNKDLQQSIKRGEFREDLYYRLKVVEVTLPPLRERREDIPLLVNHFIDRLNAAFGKRVKAVSDDVLKAFIGHAWPGNVRQLAHALEHVFVTCHDAVITMGHLPPEFARACGTRGPASGREESSEPQAICRALEKTAWNKAMAARLLGMSRRTLYRKLKEYGTIEDKKTKAV